MSISFINTTIHKAYSNENIRKFPILLVVRDTLCIFFLRQKTFTDLAWFWHVVCIFSLNGEKNCTFLKNKIFSSDLISYQHYTFPGHYILTITNTQNQSYPSHSWLSLQIPEQITKNNDNTQKYTLL